MTWHRHKQKTAGTCKHFNRRHTQGVRQCLKERERESKRKLSKGKGEERVVGFVLYVWLVWFFGSQSKAKKQVATLYFRFLWLLVKRIFVFFCLSSDGPYYATTTTTSQCSLSNVTSFHYITLVGWKILKYYNKSR